MAEGRTTHSLMGAASFVLASFSGLLLASLALLAWSLRGWDPPGDEAAYGFGLIMLSFLLVLAEILALGLGVAGTLQRRRKRSFALLGVACSALMLAVILAQVDWVGFIASFSEPIPKVHIVPSGNE